VFGVDVVAKALPWGKMIFRGWIYLIKKV